MTKEQVYFKALQEAVECERSEEENYFKSVIASSTIRQKVDNGFAWYPVNIMSKRYTIGEYLEVEITRAEQSSGHHRIKEGVGVSLFNVQGNEKVEFSGVVSWLRKNKMRIILQNGGLDKDDIPEKGLTGVELVYDERPYKVMKETLEQALISKEESVLRLKSLLVHELYQDNPYSTSDQEIMLPPYLNDAQQFAIRSCLNSDNVSIIHGPPGTGKTTTIVAMIRQLAMKEKRILVCAPSNNAVDLLAEKISEQNIDTLRIGNVTRIGDKVMHLTLEEKAKANTDWQHIKKVKIQAEEAEKLAGKFKRQFGHVEREERFALKREARELRKWARELELKLSKDIVGNAKVVVSTLIGAANDDLANLVFDTVIIDEASQSLEPESWVALLKGKRHILVGDHKQLPPTVKSRNAVQMGLEKTLLDKLSVLTPQSYLLNIQYRMNDLIMSFSNHKFYQGKLRSYAANKDKTLRSLAPLAFIDTAGAGFEEKQNPESKSYLNEGEFFIIREHLLANRESILGASIGIISPYAEQVKFITQSLEEEKELLDLEIEANTIDGFQGQERDVIYISLARSNDRGEIGFLADERRLNVAMTRAKMALNIIGDSATLGKNQLFSDLLDYFESKSAMDSAWNYMGSYY